MGAECEIKGNKPLCSAELNDKHRVQLILRYIPALKKLVIVLLTDDSGHQYKIKKNNYGSDEHWNEIVRLIHSENYYQKATIVSPLIKPVMAETKQVMQSNNEYPAESEQLSGETDSKSEPVLLEPSPVKVSSNKKKKKKKTELVNEFELLDLINDMVMQNYRPQNMEKLYNLFEPCNEYYVLAMAQLVASPQKVRMITDLLDLGMNPDIFHKEKPSLMQMAIAYNHIDIVKLLLDRGASLSSYYKGKSVSFLGLSLVKGDINPEITRLLMQKTKEKGDLNALMPGLNKIPLHFAIEHCKVEYVRMLLEEGADPSIKDPTTSLNPVQRIMHFNQNHVLSSERKADARAILTLLLEFQKKHDTRVTEINATGLKLPLSLTS